MNATLSSRRTFGKVICATVLIGPSVQTCLGVNDEEQPVPQTATPSGSPRLPMDVESHIEGFKMSSDGFSMHLVNPETGESMRTVLLQKAVAATDQLNPYRTNYYAYPLIRLIPNPHPLEGQPSSVWKFSRIDGQIRVTMKFRRFSKLDRMAGESTLERAHHTYLEDERQRLERPELAVVVNRAPIIDILISVQDAQGICLSYARQNVHNGGDDLALNFSFSPAGYDRFVSDWSEQAITFQPIYRCSGKRFELGTSSTQATINVREIFSQELTSEQQSGSMPIFQGDFDRIKRRIAAVVKRSGTFDGPAVVNLVQIDDVPLMSLFEPASWLSPADFRRAFGTEGVEMLALHLKPLGLIQHSMSTKSSQTGNQNTKETSSSLGGGFQLKLPIFNFGGTGEKHSRDIETISQLSGVELQEGSTKETFSPHRIKVLKLAKGWEARRLDQTTSVAVGIASSNSYLADTPFSQDFSTNEVDAALAVILKECRIVTDLRASLSKKRNRVEELKAQITPAIAEEQRQLHSLTGYGGFLQGHFEGAMVYSPIADGRDRYQGTLEHLKRTRGVTPPEGIDVNVKLHFDGANDSRSPGKTRDEACNNSKAHLADHVRGHTEKCGSLANALHEIQKQNSVARKAWTELATLVAEITVLEAKLDAALDR